MVVCLNQRLVFQKIFILIIQYDVMATDIRTASAETELISWLERKGIELRVSRKDRPSEFHEFTHSEYASLLQKIWEGYLSNGESLHLCEVSLNDEGLVDATKRSLDSLVSYPSKEAEQLSLWLYSKRYELSSKLSSGSLKSLKEYLVMDLASYFLSSCDEESAKFVTEDVLDKKRFYRLNHR